ncbi:hypothetical protein [Corynebacterium sp. CCUG 51687]|uniref:hypothetical protein n=1 Tax=Corynebacterium sp. CCUG 51687 TaxID=2823897 RepID=UPI00210DD25F
MKHAFRTAQRQGRLNALMQSRPLKLITLACQPVTSTACEQVDGFREITRFESMTSSLRHVLSIAILIRKHTRLQYRTHDLNVLEPLRYVACKRISVSSALLRDKSRSKNGLAQIRKFEQRFHGTALVREGVEKLL